LKPRETRAKDTDGEHPTIEQIGGVVLRPDEPNDQVHPDEEECCRHRNAHGGSVRAIASLACDPCIRVTRATQEGAGDRDIVRSQTTASVHGIATKGSSKMHATASATRPADV
jgi:hypothetical protein